MDTEALARKVAEYANTCCYRSDGFEEDVLGCARSHCRIGGSGARGGAKVCEDPWQEEATAAANGTQEPKYHDCIECAHAIRERSNVKKRLALEARSLSREVQRPKERGRTRVRAHFDTEKSMTFR